jgi:hypothetical protein
MPDSTQDSQDDQEQQPRVDLKKFTMNPMVTDRASSPTGNAARGVLFAFWVIVIVAAAYGLVMWNRWAASKSDDACRTPSGDTRVLQGEFKEGALRSGLVIRVAHDLEFADNTTLQVTLADQLADPKTGKQRPPTVQEQEELGRALLERLRSYAPGQPVDVMLVQGQTCVGTLHYDPAGDTTTVRLGIAVPLPKPGHAGHEDEGSPGR